MPEPQVLLKRLRDTLAVIANNADTLPPTAVQSLAALGVAAADAELERDTPPAIRRITS